MVPSVSRCVPGGRITFVVRNTGTLDHELVVLRTSRAPGRLPVKGSGASEAGFQGETPELRAEAPSDPQAALRQVRPPLQPPRALQGGAVFKLLRPLTGAHAAQAAPPRGRDAPGPHHPGRARPLLSSHTALLEQGGIVTSSTMSSAPDARGRFYSPAEGAAVVPGFRTGLPRVVFLRSVAVRRRSSMRADGRTGPLPNVRDRGRRHLPSLSAEPATPSGLTVLPRGGPSARIPWAGRGRARRRTAAPA